MLCCAVLCWQAHACSRPVRALLLCQLQLPAAPATTAARTVLGASSTQRCCGSRGTHLPAGRASTAGQQHGHHMSQHTRHSGEARLLGEQACRCAMTPRPRPAGTRHPCHVTQPARPPSPAAHQGTRLTSTDTELGTAGWPSPLHARTGILQSSNPACHVSVACRPAQLPGWQQGGVWARLVPAAKCSSCCCCCGRAAKQQKHT